MRLTFDLDLRQIVTALGVNSSLSSLFFTRGDSQDLEIQFSRNGVVVDPGASSIFFCVKPSGVYDTDALVLCTDFTKTGSGSTTLWTGQPNFNNPELDAALGVGEDPDVASLTAAAEVGFVVSGRQTTSRTIRCVIENDLYRDGEVSPSAYPSGNNVTFYSTITALTGGTSANLDYLPTTSVPVGVVVQFVISGILNTWQLQAGTAAEDTGAGIVRPDDYATSTNEKNWIRLA